MDDTVDIELYYGGKLENSPTIKYVGGKMETYPRVDIDFLSPVVIRKCSSKLGFPEILKCWVKFPTDSFENLRSIDSDQDAIDLIKLIVDGKKTDIEVYIEHGENTTLIIEEDEHIDRREPVLEGLIEETQDISGLRETTGLYPERAFASATAKAVMGNPQPQFSLLNLWSENLSNSSTPTPHSDQRHTTIAGRFRDALFSAVAPNYVNGENNNHSLPFIAEKVKSEIERHLHEYLPSFHTPNHLPYASMIQRAITELGEEDGSSEESVSDFIKKEYEDLPWAHVAFLRRHLRKLCESGELVNLKCGKYTFKMEDKGVKRKKQRGKTTVAERRQRRRVRSIDGVEEFDMIKKSPVQIIVGLPAQEAPTIKATEEQSDSFGEEIKGTEQQSGSLREEMDGAEEEDHAQEGQIEVLDKPEEVGGDKMIDRHREEKGLGEVVEEPMEKSYEGPDGEEGPSIETALEFFDSKSKLSSVEENESIDAQCLKKLRVGIKNVEYFDAKSDQADDEGNEMIDALSFKGKVLNGLSDDRNKLLEQSFKVNDDRNQLDKAETNITSNTNIAGSLLLEHQTETAENAEQGKTCTPESGENANAEILLPSDIICSHKSRSLGHHGRGRPRKLSIHKTVVLSLPSSDQDSNQQLQEINSEDDEASRPNIHETSAVPGTHHIDQQQHQKPAKGRGRGRGRHQVVMQDQISTSETVSPPKNSHQLHPTGKRGLGRPLKQKSDADILLENILTSKSEHDERKRRGRGRPRKVL